MRLEEARKVARVFITGSSDGLGLMAARLLIEALRTMERWQKGSPLSPPPGCLPPFS